MTDALDLNQYELFLKAKQMTDSVLVEEYRTLVLARKSGEERKYPDLQDRLQILSAEATKRGFKIASRLYAQKEEEVKEEKPAEVEMIDTPQSSSIGAYGYDENLKLLYVRYKSGKTTYTYTDVSPKMYADLQRAESKGKFISRNIKGKKSLLTAKAAGIA